MSPILDLQHRLVEVGRIRMGNLVATTNGGTRPGKLDKWRITSSDADRIRAAAEAYGGEPHEWDGHQGQWELYTSTDQLDVMLVPGQTISQWYELWQGPECSRRCDGLEQTDGKPCICPPMDERDESGTYCKPTTRLSVLLPAVPGIGRWRLDCHGYYAAVELAATARLLEEATRRGALLPARLRIEQRTVVRGKQTRRFAVPVLDVDVGIMDVYEFGRTAVPGELPPAHTPVEAPPRAGVSVSGALETVSEQRALATRSQTPIGAPIVQDTIAIAPSPSGPEPSASQPEAPRAPEPGTQVAEEAGPQANPPSDPEDDSPVISQAQRRLLFKTAREAWGTDGETRLRELIEYVTGDASTGKLTVTQFERVMMVIPASEPAGAVTQPPAPVGQQ